jgi:hypothetical protein
MRSCTIEDDPSARLPRNHSSNEASDWRLATKGAKEILTPVPRGTSLKGSKEKSIALRLCALASGVQM